MDNIPSTFKECLEKLSQKELIALKYNAQSLIISELRERNWEMNRDEDNFSWKKQLKENITSFRGELSFREYFKNKKDIVSEEDALKYNELAYKKFSSGPSYVYSRQKVLRDYFNLEAKRDRGIGGIYLIDDFYVGQSVKIRDRIYAHISTACQMLHYNENVLSARRHTCKDSRIAWNFLHGNPMPVTILSADTSKEYYFIRSLSEIGFNLLNKSAGDME